MTFGQRIKKLRRDADMTQEQLAEILMISPQAVSRWETDAAMPDISMLPTLVRLFGVSADELLGITLEKDNEKIEQALAAAEEAIYSGDFEEAVTILKDAYRQFPRSHHMMQRLADAIVSVKSRQGEIDYEDVFSLCRRVLDECTDSVLRYETIQTLCEAYGYADKMEELRQLAEQMPHAWCSQENLMLYHWSSKEDLGHMQEYAYYLISQLLQTISVICGAETDDGLVYSNEERMQLRKASVAILDLLYPDGDFQYAAQYGAALCRNIAQDHLRTDDIDAAKEWIERYAGYSIHMDTYDFEAAHSSPLLRGYKSGGWIMEQDGNCSELMLSWLTFMEEDGSLPCDEWLKALRERLEKTAKKHK